MKRYIPVVLALVIGGALSLIAHAFTRDWEEARARQGFEREVFGHAASLSQEITSAIEAVISIRAFYGASEEVERAEFSAFSAVEMTEQHHGIQALEWIPRVAAADRAAFEAAARADGLAGFGFTERESQGRMVAAAARAVYFPVYFVEPLAGNEAALGFDLGSNPARLAALEKARDSGEVVATARITLVQETGEQYGFLVFEPVYRIGAPVGTVAERRAALEGFGLGVLRIGDIVEAALEHREPMADVMDVFIFDISASAGQRLLYPKSTPVEDRADISVAGCVDISLRVADRDWLFVHCPAGGAAVGHWQSSAVLIAGLAITGMLSLYLLLMLRQRARTERLAEGLRASEERYRGLYDNAHDMIQSVDVEGRFSYINPAWTEAMGYSLDDLDGVSVFDLIAPESKPHCLDAFKAIMTGEARDNVPVTFIRKDGGRLETEGNIAPQFSAGRIVATQGIFRDVSERRLHEERERKARTELERVAGDLTQLIDTANAPIFGVDTNGRITEWNRAAAEVTGYAKDEVMDCNMIDEFVAEEHKASAREVLARALGGEAIANYELQLTSRRGSPLLILLNATPRRDTSGKIIGVFGIGQDITERKRVEAELIQAAKMATLGEMATGVAHELNQPLNVIRMAADSTIERIEEGDFDADYLRRKLERISAQTERAAAIIDHMRIFGRKTDEKPALVDLREVVRDALGLMGEQIRLHGIEIETDFPEACRMVSGHAVQLEQVLLNLLGNARDAIEANRQGPGEPRRITVTVEDTGPEDKVGLIVEDSGGGIPETIIKRIFEPFFTTKETGKGTGLGLSISYGIVNDMGGAIAAANAGDGARITITLPAIAEQTAAAR